MSVQAVLIRKITKEIIKHGDYPNEDMSPVLGLDPDYEWLVKNIPFPEPDYDPRVFIMVTNIPDLEFLDQFQEHPQYPGIKEYRITYTPEKRPNEDIIRSIENAQKQANDLIISESNHKDEFVYMMAAVDKASTGIELTPEEQSYRDKLSDVNMKLAKNLDNKNILVDQVNASLTPNIDEGWESV